MKIPSARAFTLIEIIMMAVIIAMSAAIIAPRMAQFIGVADLETEARKLAADLRKAQQLAITEQKMYKFVVNVDPANNYEIKKETGCCPMTWAIVNQRSVHNGVKVVSTTFTSPPYPAPDTMDFNFFGAPTPGPGGQIVLQDSGGNSMTVSIEPVTGKVAFN